MSRARSLLRAVRARLLAAWAVTSIAFVFAHETPANAQPSLWEKAKAPIVPAGKLSTDEVHRQAATAYEKAQMFGGCGELDDPLGGAQAISLLDGSRKLLESQNAEASADPRLRYDYGLVLSCLRRWPAAKKALEAAVKLAPHHVMAHDGWFELAITDAHLGDHAGEEKAYLEALDLTDRATSRSIIYSNLAESRMAQGKLAEAIDAAEQAIDLDGENPAARWNLAILHDRAGDSYRALEAARHALEYDPDLEMVEGSRVFFEPPYDREWYRALAELAMAERLTGDARNEHLMRALVAYGQFAEAAPESDKFRPRALENVERLEKILKLAPLPPAKASPAGKPSPKPKK